MRQHPLVQMLAIGTVASVVGTVIVLVMEWFPPQASHAADDIDLLYDVLLICSVPVFVLVMTVAIYCVVKFRAKPGDMSDGPPIHGNTRLEVIWVTVPFIMVSVLAVYSWIVLDDIEAKEADEQTIKVTGQQFTWQFEYDHDGRKVPTTELVLVKDQPYKFDIQARDVIHSFWVPEFRMKQDAVPGITTTQRITPTRLGRYTVVCAELCGIGHATMRQRVRVVESEQELTSFLDRAAPPDAGGGEQQ